jgi:hypothetical protein
MIHLLSLICQFCFRKFMTDKLIQIWALFSYILQHRLRLEFESIWYDWSLMSCPMFRGCNRLQVPARQEEPTWSWCTRMTLPGNPEILEIRLVFSSIYFVFLFNDPFDWPVWKTSVKKHHLSGLMDPCGHAAILQFWGQSLCSNNSDNTLFRVCLPSLITLHCRDV